MVLLNTNTTVDMADRRIHSYCMKPLQGEKLDGRQKFNSITSMEYKNKSIGILKNKS